MKERLKARGLETGFEDEDEVEDDVESEEVEEGRAGQDGIDDMFEVPMPAAAAAQ
jgi:casein kinase II subunit beta